MSNVLTLKEVAIMRDKCAQIMCDITEKQMAGENVSPYFQRNIEDLAIALDRVDAMMARDQLQASLKRTDGACESPQGDENGSDKENNQEKGAGQEEGHPAQEENRIHETV